MKTRGKIFYFAILSIIVVISITFTVLFKIANTFSIRNEEKDFEQNFRRINLVIDAFSSSLTSTALDWAFWDDTYDFLENRNDQYIEANLNETTLESLNLNFMLFFTNRFDIVYDLTNATLEQNKRFLDEISLDQLIQSNLAYNSPAADNLKTGLILSSGQIILVCVSPISTSDGKGDSNGILIIGRILDRSFFNYLDEATQETVEFISSDVSNLFFDNNLRNIKISSLDEDLQIIQQNKTSTGYKQIKDIYGNYSIPVYLTIERRNYFSGKSYFFIFFGIFAAFIHLSAFTGAFLFDKYLSNRLRSLHDFIEAVGKNRDTGIRISLSGKDNIADLGNAMNNMLNELDNAYREIKLMDERFRLVMEATNDGFLDYDITHSELYISSHWIKYIGLQNNEDENLVMEYLQSIHPDHYARILAFFHYFLQSTDETFQQEYRVNKISGETIWILHRGKVTRRDKHGKPIRVICTLTDITSQKRNEEEILLFSYSDKLTGLANRAYIEKILDELEKEGIAQYSIIMGDLNGLRLINDAFGHKEGDRMLICVADILKLACDEDDIISRWGGDEFVILIKNKDYSYVSDLIVRIKDYCDKFNGFPLKISIALGSADNLPGNYNIDATLQLAEERMYRNKLMESKSARSALILTLERSLFEKHNETEDHTIRLNDICIKIGNELHLSQEKLDELSLLSALHDIGKIGIPDHILTKPGKLTKEEWEIMKTHTEIGYRIAMSTPELAYIADTIMYHHEKYDGTGYPQGLKGEEIPLISRILNIVDSFDVMTHRRSYKEPMSLEDAVMELRNCSGKQFDPELVTLFIQLIEEKKISIQNNDFS